MQFREEENAFTFEIVKVCSDGPIRQSQEVNCALRVVEFSYRRMCCS